MGTWSCVVLSCVSFPCLKCMTTNRFIDNAPRVIAMTVNFIRFENRREGKKERKKKKNNLNDFRTFSEQLFFFASFRIFIQFSKCVCVCFSAKSILLSTMQAIHSTLCCSLDNIQWIRMLLIVLHTLRV